MLCETCRWTERPGFVRVAGRAGRDDPADMVPCPDCGGQGIAHCCDGICAQPDTPEQPERNGAGQADGGEAGNHAPNVSHGHMNRRDRAAMTA